MHSSTEHYPSVYVIALAGCALQTAYSIFWSFTAVAVYQKFHPNAEGSTTSGGTPSNATLIGLMVYCVFSFYWTSRESHGLSATGLR